MFHVKQEIPVPRSKPTEAQRAYLNQFHPNSIMARLTVAKRREIEAKRAQAIRDSNAFERTIRQGSEPRRG
jgi:hypothetical protein